MEESRLGEAAAMAQKAAELDSSEFDVVFSAAHMLRYVFVCLSKTHCDICTSLVSGGLQVDSTCFIFCIQSY